MDTNYYGTQRLTEEMLSRNLISRNGKILFMSSILGRLTMIKISHPDVYRSLVIYKRSNFGMGDLAEFVKRFEVESRDPELIKKWHPNPYDTSKCFVAIWAYLLG